MFIYLFSIWSSHLTVSRLGVTDSVFFPSSIWNVSIFQAHPCFLRCCFLFAFLTCFMLSAWISYLVFKLEVVVTAECQMFRLICLQHILMWIYWWMRRKFLIKSTVQSKTPISLMKCYKCTYSRAEVQFLVQLCKCFCLILQWDCWSGLLCERHGRQWPVPFLIYSIHREYGHALAFNTIVVRFLWTKPHFCAKLCFGIGAFEAGWRLTAVHWWCRQNHWLAALLSVTPGNRITVPAGKEKCEIQQHKQEWKQQGQGNRDVKN